MGSLTEQRNEIISELLRGVAGAAADVHEGVQSIKVTAVITLTMREGIISQVVLHEDKIIRKDDK